MKTLKWVTTGAFVFMLAVNALANILPINGLTTGEVSAAYPSMFTPAGYVFSIWGLIYLGLLLLVIYQWASKNGDALAARMGTFFAVSSVLNGCWILAWHYGVLWLSVAIMLGLLLCLIILYLRLGIGRKETGVAERWMVRVPISIYLGWISVATIANISVWLLDGGWDGWGMSPVLWTVILLIVAAGLNGLMIWLRHEIAFPLVFVWAAVGIFVANGFVSWVAIVALVLAAVVLAGLVWALVRRWPKKPVAAPVPPAA